MIPGNSWGERAPQVSTSMCALTGGEEVGLHRSPSGGRNAEFYPEYVPTIGLRGSTQHRANMEDAMIRKGCGRISRFRWRGASVAPDAAGGTASLSRGGARSRSATSTTGSSTGTLRLRSDRDRGRPRVLLTYSRVRQVRACSRRRRGVVLAASGVGGSVSVAGSWAERHGSGQQDLTASRLLLQERCDELLRSSPRTTSGPPFKGHALAPGEVVQKDAAQLPRQRAIEDAHVALFVVCE